MFYLAIMAEFATLYIICRAIESNFHTFSIEDVEKIRKCLNDKMDIGNNTVKLKISMSMLFDKNGNLSRNAALTTINKAINRIFKGMKGMNGDLRVIDSSIGVDEEDIPSFVSILKKDELIASLSHCEKEDNSDNIVYFFRKRM